MMSSNRWAGMFGLVRLFSPPVPPLLFAPPDCFFFPVQGFLFTLYPLDFFTYFIYSLASFTVQFFVDGIMMSSFFTPRGTPRRSATQRHPASARALSLSLLLGLSPLAGITPAALATPTQAASDQQAQPAQVTPASPADEQKKPDNPVGMKLTSGTLNISEGGTVSVTTAPLSAEFRAKYTLYEFGIVERGKNYLQSYYGDPLPEAQYGSKVASLMLRVRLMIILTGASRSLLISRSSG